MAYRGSTGLGLVLTLTIAVAADVAVAACTQSSEARTLKKSVRQAMTCDYRALRAGTTNCTVTPPPACAGTLATDANNLAYGLGTLVEVDKRLLRDQLKCQKRIGKAVSDTSVRSCLSDRGRTPKRSQLISTRQAGGLLRRDRGTGCGSGPVLPAAGRARPRLVCRRVRSIRWLCATVCANSARCGWIDGDRTRNGSGRTSSSS